MSSLALVAGQEPVPGYFLAEPLGTGGYGEVWKAWAPGGLEIAMKFSRVDTSQGPAEGRAFEIVRQVRHAHLLDLHFAHVADQFLILGMPLCDQTLWQRFEWHQQQGRAGIPLPELLEYIRELSHVLDFLAEQRHDLGTGELVALQHRDIKPQNIFLMGESVKLADFGLMAVLGESHTDGECSPHYASPEVLIGGCDRTSDQYSLATTYYQLRTGALPFEGNYQEVIFAKLEKPADLGLLFGAERSALARALSQNPAKRWESCQAFINELDWVVRQDQPGEVQPRSRKTSRNLTPATLVADTTESDEETLAEITRTQSKPQNIKELFDIEKSLSRKGGRRVYRAVEKKSGRQVLLKVVAASNPQENELLHRRLHEVKILKEFTHACLPEFYQSGYTEDNEFFLAMELIEGTDLLQEVRRQKSLDALQFSPQLQELSSALHLLHSRDIVHRDIRPHNIFVQPDGSIRLLGFIFAKTFRQEGDLAVTLPGMTWGTAEFMSPEQALGHKLDHRSDVYSLGVTCFYCLTGDLPFAEKTQMKTMAAHVYRPVPRFESKAPHLSIPEEIEDVVRKALEKSPDDRHQSVMEFADRFADASVASAARNGF